MDRQDVYRELFNRVVHGKYPPGQRLREDAIGKEFGVSRTPVREALFQLAQDGLAESTPKRGFCSRGFSVDDLEEAYEIRRVLEVLALERAAKTLPIRELSGIRARIESLAQSDDPMEHANTDSDLHQLIVDSSRAPRIIHLLSSLYRVMRTFRELGFESPNARRLARQEHLDLISALATRDVARATAVLDGHISASKSRILEQVMGRTLVDA